MRIYESLLRPMLFALDPERAHQGVLALLELAAKIPGAAGALGAAFSYSHPSLETEVAGLRFPNPVGLAAGFDKDCRLAGILPAFGFGFIEVGTVVARPQAGNPKPRLFRVPECDALINRLGFNSRGASHAAEKLRALRSRPVPIGVNLGINADTPAGHEVQGYLDAFRALQPFGDYYVLNVSSPNTPGLRELQDRIRLERILTALRSVNAPRKPIFVKLSPDIPPAQLDHLLPLLRDQAEGLVVCNTTVSRPGLPDRWADVRGGLSGLPLRDRSTQLIAEIYRRTEGELPVIGVGGIFGPEDAYQKLRAGASLVQVYTGWIYRGPGLVATINRGLAELLKDHGLSCVRDAVGRSVEVLERKP
ncbi:MAG: quinone-dependent dihydroorotate dehydrogenase [Elusimicrobia bacterium]|nr:quinone-dependent dihydroorotate dehydrogenase [Elusimicrobiota bacterium]